MVATPAAIPPKAECLDPASNIHVCLLRLMESMPDDSDCKPDDPNRCYIGVTLKSGFIERLDSNPA